ncbi:MAG: type IV pilus secretin PilQ family protein [Xanthomonadales bacterium]|nr:type IV pilus secretin PilQ family protein [Xanthomonadales bacterium]
MPAPSPRTIRRRWSSISPRPATRIRERRVGIGAGLAIAASPVEAGGRTRVVIDLMAPAGFETRIEDNRVVVSIASAGAATVGLGGDDPAKAVGTAAAAVGNIDFRRGPNGEGRVVVSFTAEGAGADLRRTGQRVVVEFSGVTLPDHFAERLDVTDFATPVQSIETRPTATGARMEIAVQGDFEQMAYQTGREFVVEIAPKREEKVEDGVARPDQPKQYVGERITFNFQDIAVRTVLQVIADQAGINIVAADSVQGNITLRLIDVPWDQALDIILRARGLDQRRDGNVIWVAPQKEIADYEQALLDARRAIEERVDLVSEYIQINYANAEEIAKLLTEEAKTGRIGGGQDYRDQRGFLSQRGSVSFDRRTNTLLVNDTPDKVREIKELIKILDRAVDQVLIEARIVIASDSFRRELGTRFGISAGYEDRHGNVFTSTGTAAGADRMSNIALRNRFAGRGTGLPVTQPGLGPGEGVLVPSLNERLNVNLPVTNPAGSIALAILGQDYLLDLELSALQAEGKGEVISQPRVIAANQQPAGIKQGQEVGYVTIAPTQGPGQIPIPNVQFKEVALVLQVTPTITQDRRVFLNMQVRKDEVSGFIDTSIGQVPQVDTREINTAVLVNDGETVVLGGVYEFASRQDLSKVPFLADLPAVGNLFKKRTRGDEKAELLIFVTPRIIPASAR